MAQWSNFYEEGEFEPELVVGMHDRWLSQLASGPTQAERVLFHTPMMEVAHERRFVVNEIKQNMSDFEVEHTRRMGLTIAHLESHFAKHRAAEPEDSILHQSKVLIGLALFPAEPTFVDAFLGTNRSLDTSMPPFKQVLELLSSRSVPQEEPATTEVQFGMPLTVDDSENVSDAVYEDCLEMIRTVSKQSRKGPGKKPRQIKAVRIRRDIALCRGDESDESDGKPVPKRARR